MFEVEGIGFAMDVQFQVRSLVDGKRAGCEFHELRPREIAALRGQGVHVGPDNRLEGATKIGEKADAEGTVTFDVPADVSGQYIVVWFTRLNADDNGKRRAWLNEVVVTG